MTAAPRPAGNARRDHEAAGQASPAERYAAARALQAASRTQLAAFRDPGQSVDMAQTKGQNAATQQSNQALFYHLSTSQRNLI